MGTKTCKVSRSDPNDAAVLQTENLLLILKQILWRYNWWYLFQKKWFLQELLMNFETQLIVFHLFSNLWGNWTNYIPWFLSKYWLSVWQVSFQKHITVIII